MLGQFYDGYHIVGFATYSEDKGWTPKVTIYPPVRAALIRPFWQARKASSQLKPRPSRKRYGWEEIGLIANQRDGG
jgi:hypothetical protein